jgi:hypothetical protein
MNLRSIVLLDLIGLLLVLWTFHLVRVRRLYAGYGVIFSATTAITMVMISVPGVQAVVTTAVGATYPASALTLLALGFIILTLLYAFTQLTILSDRLADVVQLLAIRDAERAATIGTEPDRSAAASSRPNSHQRDALNT